MNHLTIPTSQVYLFCKHAWSILGLFQRHINLSREQGEGSEVQEVRKTHYTLEHVLNLTSKQWPESLQFNLKVTLCPTPLSARKGESSSGWGQGGDRVRVGIGSGEVLGIDNLRKCLLSLHCVCLRREKKPTRLFEAPWGCFHCESKAHDCSWNAGPTIYCPWI